MSEDLLKKAQQCCQDGDFTTAIRHYDTLLTQATEDSNKVDLYHLKTQAYAQLSDYDAAATELQKALSLNQNRSDLWHTKAILACQQQQFSQAITDFKHALQLQATHLPSLQGLAKLYYQLGEYQNAHQYYQRLLDLSPDNVTAYFELALTCIQLQDLDQAIKQLQKAIAIDPNFSKAYGQLGQILLQQKQYKEAAVNFSLRLNLDPHHAETWHSLGQAELHLGKITESIQSFKNCIADNSQHHQVNQDLANAYVRNGDFALALTHYFRQLEVQANADCFYNIGVILMYQEHNKDALQYLKHALELDPSNLGGHINLANIYLKQNKHKEAAEHYEQALVLNPDNPEVSHILAAIKQDTLPDKAPAEYLSHLFDQYAPFYDQHLSQQLKYAVPRQLRELIEHDYNIDHAWRILDLGCGTGLSGTEFKAMAQELIGIDIASNMLEIAASKNLYDQLITADIHAALQDFHDIDLIVAADVFTYTGDLLPLLQSCYHSLKSTGLLTFSVEKSHSEGFTLQQNIRYAHHIDYLNQSLQQAQFVDIDITPTILREQHKKPVHGYLVIAKKP